MKSTVSPLRHVVVLALLFFGATGGAWAWYHVAPKQFPVSYRFVAREKVPGWTFKPEAVSREVTDVLATTNLVNGTYQSVSGRRITAFMGTWDAGNPKQLAVVSHSPDVCWVGAGWKPVPVDHPDKLTIDFGTDVLPFEARTFEAPGGRHRELTVWCTLVSGQVYEEQGRFLIQPGQADQSLLALKAAGARQLRRTQLIKAVRDRIPGDGTKQFVRFSIEMPGDWRPALEELRTFGRAWLELERETNPVN